MLPHVVVIVDIAHSLAKQLSFTSNAEDPWDIEFEVIGKVGAFEMGVFLSVSLMILDEAAAKATNKLAQVSDLHPALTAELLAVIHGEDDLALDPM